MKSPKSLQVQITEKSIDSFWSWIVCISSFSLQFLVGGLHCSFGIFFVALLDKFGRSEAETGKFSFDYHDFYRARIQAPAVFLSLTIWLRFSIEKKIAV